MRIDCTDAGCTIERELAITNTSGTAYDGLVLDPLAVEVVGLQARRVPLADLVADERFQPILRRLCAGMDEATCLQGVWPDASAQGSSTAPPYAYGTPLQIEPGQTARVVERVRPLSFAFPRLPEDVKRGCPGSVTPAPIETRHLVFGAWRERRPRVGTAVVAANGTVTITFPPEWMIAMPGQGPRTVAPDRSGRAVLEATTRESIAIERTLPAASWIRRGGPFIAAGGSGERDSMRFALRAGYEVANRGWLIYSAAVETDFERVTVAPVVEAALPTNWHAHWAVGAGVTIELAERRDVGVRAQLALHMLSLGFVAVLDYFPANDIAVFGAFGQLSL